MDPLLYACYVHKISTSTTCTYDLHFTYPENKPPSHFLRRAQAGLLLYLAAPPLESHAADR